MDRLWVSLLMLVGMLKTATQDSLGPEIRSLHIRSDIGFRFANTTVSSQLANAEREAAEVVFRVKLPKTAFITSFSMKIDGVTYYGNVKETEEAKIEYESAVSQGRSAGRVATTVRDSNSFEVSVNVAAEKKVNFELIYQEVLQRRLGYYEHKINIDPGQVVPDLQVEVHINESRNIRDLFVPAIRKRNEKEILNHDKPNRHAIIEKIAPHAVKVTYKPEKEVQMSYSERGLAGQFKVRYDVERALDSGEILVVNGYFVHALAPEGLLPVPKNILFILDVSGSMSGRKMPQLKDAMNAILDDLRHEDNFNLMTFDSRIRFWKNSLMKVDEENINKGKAFINKLRPRGMTNINSALKKGIDFLSKQPADISEQPSIIIFLTDGMPTVGERKVDKIISNVRHMNKNEFAIFSLGFGNAVDINFLKELSLLNGGVARKIYEASDAGIQLKTFYREVSIPLLSDVQIKYETKNGKVTQVTKHVYKTYFSGGEMFVAGKVAKTGVLACSMRPCLMGRASLGKINICKPWPPVRLRNVTTQKFPPPSRPWVPETGLAAYVERMWAYLTIKQLLDQDLTTHNETQKKELKKKALALSLQFNFVTPLTSMVVTRPDNSTKVGILRDSDAVNDVVQKSTYFSRSRGRKPVYSAHPGMQYYPVPGRNRPNYRIASGSYHPALSGGPRSVGNSRTYAKQYAPRPTSRSSRRRPSTGRRYRGKSSRRNRGKQHRRARPTNTNRRLQPRVDQSVYSGISVANSAMITRSTPKVITTRQPTPQAPVSTLAPVTPSVKVHLSTSNSSAACLAWPRMKFSAHTVLHDQDVKIVASHGQKGLIQSVMIQTPSEAHLISLTSILIGGSLSKSWSDTYSGNNVTLTGSKVTLEFGEGFTVAVNKLGAELVLEMVDISGISDQAAGLLKRANLWTIWNNRLRISANKSFPFISQSQGGATCYIPTEDIFTVTGNSARA